MPDLSAVTVMTTAYRRPYYLGRTLRAWSRADGISGIRKLVVALGTSDRTRQASEVIDRMRGQFACPVVREMQSPQAEASPSAHRAIGEAAASAFADPGCEFLICGEEDVQVSSDVLAWMGWAAERFAADRQVLAVLAHNAGGQGWDRPAPICDAGADQEACRLLPYFNPWCWGTWRDRWEQVLEPQWDWDATSGSRPDQHGYDWNIQLRIIPRGGWLCVVPDASRSQNIGELEGGYSRQDLFPLTQSQSFRPRRGPCEYRLVAAEEAAR